MACRPPSERISRTFSFGARPPLTASRCQLRNSHTPARKIPSTSASAPITRSNDVPMSGVDRAGVKEEAAAEFVVSANAECKNAE